MDLYTLERFEKYTVPEPNTGCLLWTKCTNKGYAQMTVNGKCQTVMRLVWSHFNNKNIPDNVLICHKCDTPQCVNPEHLWVGTYKDNNQDKSRKGRHPNTAKTNCPKGHEYTVENTRARNGARWCRACDRLRLSGWERQRRAQVHG